MKKTTTIKFAILAADTVLFIYKNNELFVRLIKVNRPPHFINAWGLPGGLLHPDETADQTAERNLWEKGGVKDAYLEQLYTFSAIDRDPRGRVVAVAYLALADHKQISANDKIASEFEPQWFSLSKLPKLAYDHRQVIAMAKERLQSKLEYTTIAINLLPESFTLSELQKLYETVLENKFDRRNFRKKILSLKIIKKTGAKQFEGAHRPAILYRFVSRSVKTLPMI